jgi:hypothetical protein
MAMKKRFYTMNSQMMAYDEGGVTKDFLTGEPLAWAG